MLATPAENGPWVRDAVVGDVAAICRFGDRHIRDHYAPIIGPGPAQAQVERWWNAEHIGAAVRAGRVVVAESEGEVVGVGQRGMAGSEHVIYKLYVDPAFRGRGVGPRLVAGLVAQLPAGVGRLAVEHFAGNTRAGAFYEREGFAVERVEPGPTDALAVVWRARRWAPHDGQGARQA